MKRHGYALSAPGLALALALAGLAAGPAAAGPLLIAPTMVEFAAGKQSAAIEVTNQSDTATDVQFRAFAWDQVEGEEQLTPTAALAISPAIATLPPGARQVFRVLDLAPSGDGVERTYRLKLSELPRGSAAAIAVRLEFSIPVFRTPAGGLARLDWSTEPTGRIRLSNTGPRRVRIASLSLTQPDGSEVPLPAASASYLLANRSRSIALPPGTRIMPGTRLRGQGDAGPIDVALVSLAAR